MERAPQHLIYAALKLTSQYSLMRRIVSQIWRKDQNSSLYKSTTDVIENFNLENDFKIKLNRIEFVKQSLQVTFIF